VPFSQRLSSSPDVGRDNQNHNRKRISGLMPCDAVAWATTRAVENAAGRRAIATAVQPTKSVTATSAGLAMPSMSNAAQHRGTSRKVGASPVFRSG
jgi:hypothetical protein